ncbi:hypothetical protein [Streptomyces sp. 6N223]|uniref:hypothetical protein n=1 Tax=Streptomyces sp. 6N223 TaxID=3457412 RepID=UPI003FD59E84
MTYEHDITGHAEGTAASVGAYGPGRDGLLPPGEREQLVRRLDQATQNFVASPREAVEMADGALAEATAQITEAIAEQGQVLRTRWQGEATVMETEKLRLLLRQYRELTEKLLHI